MDQFYFSTLFNYEFAPVPFSLFKDTRNARYTSAKSVLKNKLSEEVSSWTLKRDAVLIGGSEMLHSSVCWPKEDLWKA